MKEFVTNLLAKWLGPTFLSRAATSVVVFLSGLIGKYIPNVAPEVLEKFSQSTVEIISLGLGVLLSLALDAKNAKKPEQPVVVSDK
jgi:cadmium resistance protein CadD (predicted permease)